MRSVIKMLLVIVLLVGLISISPFMYNLFHAGFQPLRLKRHIPFVNYHLWWCPEREHLWENTTEYYNNWVLKDLDLIKKLGFKGVCLWNIEGLDEHDLIDTIFDNLKERNLYVILPLRIWQPEQFPNNETANNEFVNFVGNISHQLRHKGNLYWYVLYYAIDWDNMTRQWEVMPTPEYKSEMQRIIDTIKGNDTYHDVYIGVEFNPITWTVAPYDFVGIEGFGVFGYGSFRNRLPTTSDDYLEDSLNFFKDKGFNVYISEWGYQTLGDVPHGHCDDEFIKADLIRDYVNLVYDWDILHSYFALHDSGDGDWGLVNWDNSERGRITMRMNDALHKTNILQKYLSMEFLNQILSFNISELTLLGVFVFIIFIIFLFVRKEFR